MKRNNKGFTLVELIIATAILGIVVTGIYGFMVTGANSYRSVSSSIQLQTAAQQAMGQIQETVLDCDTAVYVPTAGEALYLLNQDSDTDKYTLCAYTLDADGLNYQQLTATTATEVSAIEGSKKHPLSELATDFMAETGESDGGRISGITITLTLERDGKSYTGTQTIALRNSPKTVDSLETLLTLAS